MVITGRSRDRLIAERYQEDDRLINWQPNDAQICQNYSLEG